MRKARKHYTAQEKVAILRRHLLDKEPVSKLCDELALQPTVLYRRQKEFLKTPPPSRPRTAALASPNRNASRGWRERSRPRMKFWPS